jgi:hypothetical protein
MKITKTDNGTAKLLFMEHEREIFSRGVGGMSYSLHLPGKIEYETVTKHKTRIGFFSQSAHMEGHSCWAPVFAEVHREEGAQRLPVLCPTHCGIKHTSIILHITMPIEPWCA